MNAKQLQQEEHRVKKLEADNTELLEALEEITTQAGGTFHNNPELAKAVLQARAAIAKAKGE